MRVSAGGIRRYSVGAYPFRKIGVHPRIDVRGQAFSGLCAKYVVLFLALSFVPASAAGKPTTVAESTAPRSWDYCYQLSRKLGWDHEADEWVKFIQDCMAGGDVTSFSK